MCDRSPCHKQAFPFFTFVSSSSLLDSTSCNSIESSVGEFLQDDFKVCYIKIFIHVFHCEKKGFISSEDFLCGFVRLMVIRKQICSARELLYIRVGNDNDSYQCRSSCLLINYYRSSCMKHQGHCVELQNSCKIKCPKQHEYIPIFFRSTYFVVE